MAFDWIAGLFQSEQTRGLSGDGASAVALDDSNPYYNYRLRRHRTEDDLVADPSLVWFTSQFVTERTGLGTHIAAERAEGVANFTDVLVILSEEDYERARADGLDAWIERTRSTLLEAFEDFCRREQFARLHSHRPLKIQVLREGSEEMGGQYLGLGPGEFITGLLPNFYTGPVQGSYPVIGVHLNLPGVWEGYQEVGRLYNDQILFTLGSHWLDNFAHPSLQEAALYRLQKYPDGSFVHIVNPDLQDRYQVTSVQQGGTNVLTLATREGHPLAYMVLALMEAPEAPPEPAPANKPGIAMPVAPSDPVRREQTIPPDVAPPMLIDDAIQPVSAPSTTQRGSKTIIPDAPSERILTFQERGALLQKVHFSAFMAGYDVYISKRGELGTVVDNPAVALQVRKRDVSLKAHIDLLVGGSRVSAGAEVPIQGDTTIEIGSERLEYRDLRGLQVDGWPYVGEIRRPASSTYLIWGSKYQIGRSRECRVVLPDEPRNDNIHWKASVGDGATIRARTGEIPKSRFYTDSIMVASEHATIDVQGDKPEVICTARHCYVYVRRQGEVLPLYPSTSGRSPQQTTLEPGDEILIGNQLFQAGYNASDAEQFTAPAAPAPEVRLSADSLIDAVSEPDFGEAAPPALLDGGFDPFSDAGADAVEASSEEAEPVAEEAPAEVSGADGDDASWEPPSEGPEPLAPMDHATPLDVIGMESVLGASLRTVADEEQRAQRDHATTGPVELPPLGREEPSVPSSLLDDDFDDEDDDLDIPIDREMLSRTLPAQEPVVDPARDAVQDWDEDDWDDVTGPPEVPSSPGETDAVEEVPAPFPDLAASLDPDLGALGDPEAKATWNDDSFDGFEDEPTEAAPMPTPPPAQLGTEPEADVAAPEEESFEEDLTGPTAFVPEAPTLDIQADLAVDTDLPSEDDAPTVVEPPPALDSLLDEPGPTEVVERVQTASVVCTDDDEAQFELGRPLHIVQAGWTVKGEVVAGNHTDADLIIPENRIVAGQRFPVRNYFSMKVRGRRGHLDILAPSEMLIDEADPSQDRYEHLADITIDVVRRDDEGEEDFVVRLLVSEDRSLPDPRARFVALDYEDPLAAALVTRGLGVDQPRELMLGGVTMTLTWNGKQVTISDYLATYRTSEGFAPFFVQHGNQRFVTAPENGDPIGLAPGDRFVVGTSVYLVRGL